MIFEYFFVKFIELAFFTEEILHARLESRIASFRRIFQVNIHTSCQGGC